VYVFIDESGDSGLSGAPGSSAIFVLVMVVFETAVEADVCNQALVDLKLRLGRSSRSEFKFGKMRYDTKLEFANAIAASKMQIIAGLLNKGLLENPMGLYGEKNFYDFALGILFDHAGPYLSNAKVKIDGQSKKYAKPRLHSLPAGKISKVRFADSTSDLLIQVADFAAGSIRRSFDLEPKLRDMNRQLLSTAFGRSTVEIFDLATRVKEKRPDS
jgi:hypothetical protein